MRQRWLIAAFAILCGTGTAQAQGSTTASAIGATSPLVMLAHVSLLRL
jgi:hypothetical protein